MWIISRIFFTRDSLKIKMAGTGWEKKWRVAEARTRLSESRSVQSFGEAKSRNGQSLMWSNWELGIGNRQFPLSILPATDRTLCFARAEQGVRVTCISKVHAIARLANTPKGKKVSRDSICWSCERSPMQGSAVIQTRANQHYCAKPLLHV